MILELNNCTSFQCINSFKYVCCKWNFSFPYKCLLFQFIGHWNSNEKHFEINNPKASLIVWFWVSTVHIPAITVNR